MDQLLKQSLLYLKLFIIGIKYLILLDKKQTYKVPMQFDSVYMKAPT